VHLRSRVGSRMRNAELTTDGYDILPSRGECSSRSLAALLSGLLWDADRHTGTGVPRSNGRENAGTWAQADRGRVFSLRDLSARLLDGSRWKSRRRADIRPPLSRRPSVAQVPAVPRRRCRTPIITRRTIIDEDHSKNAAASLYIPPLERRRNKAYEKSLFTVVE